MLTENVWAVENTGPICSGIHFRDGWRNPRAGEQAPEQARAAARAARGNT